MAALAYYSGSKRQEWIEKRASDIEFLYDQQWSGEEIGVLEARKQSTYTHNKILPIIRDYRSRLTGRIPEAHIVPTGNIEYDPVNLINDVCKHVMYNSDWFLQFRRTLDSMLVKGIGFMNMFVDPFSSGGLGDLKLKDVDSQYVYIDPTSCEPFFEDSSCIIIAMPKLKQAAIAAYPQYRELIEKSTYKDTTTNYIQKTMYGYEGKQGDIGILEDDAEGAPKVLMIERQAIELVARKRIYRTDKWLYDYSDQDYSYEPESNEIAIPHFQKRLKRIISIGDKAVELETLPVENYSLTPLVYEDVKNPYPPGLIYFLRDQQKLWNKLFLLSLHLLQITAMPRTKLRKGVGLEEQDVESKLADPGGTFWYENDGMPTDPIQFDYGSGIPNDFFAMLNIVDQGLNISSASPPYRQGQSAQLPSTAFGINLLHQQSTAQFDPLVKTIDLWVERIYKSMIQHIPLVYDIPRLMDIFIDDRGTMQTVPINIPTSQKADGSWKILNNLGKLAANVRVQTSSSISTRHQELSNWFMDAAKQSGIPTFWARAIEHMVDLPNREEIISEMSVNTQLTNDLNELQKINQEATGTIKNLEQQLMASKNQSAVKDFENKLDSIIHQVRGDLKIHEARFSERLKSIEKEMRFVKSQKGRQNKK